MAGAREMGRGRERGGGRLIGKEIYITIIMN